MEVRLSYRGSNRKIMYDRIRPPNATPVHQRRSADSVRRLFRKHLGAYRETWHSSMIRLMLRNVHRRSWMLNRLSSRQHQPMRNSCEYCLQWQLKQFVGTFDRRQEESFFLLHIATCEEQLMGQATPPSPAVKEVMRACLSLRPRMTEGERTLRHRGEHIQFRGTTGQRSPAKTRIWGVSGLFLTWSVNRAP